MELPIILTSEELDMIIDALVAQIKGKSFSAAAAKITLVENIKRQWDDQQPTI